MKIYHKYNFIDNKMTCVIYITYPLNSEFGIDFDSIRKKAIQLSEKVRKYILDISNNISDEKVLIVLNGIVIGTLILTNINYRKNVDNINLNNESIVEVDDKIEKNDVNKIENKNSTLDQTKNLQANNEINKDIKNKEQNTKNNV